MAKVAVSKRKVKDKVNVDDLHKYVIAGISEPFLP